MNKVKVTTLTVSCYDVINRFFSLNDSPQYQSRGCPFWNSKNIPDKGRADHDSYRCSRSALPCGCLHRADCTRRPRSCSPVHCGHLVCRPDSLHRLHYLHLRTGPIHVYCQTPSLHSSTSVTHTFDLVELLEKCPRPLVKDGALKWMVHLTKTRITWQTSPQTGACGKSLISTA